MRRRPMMTGGIAGQPYHDQVREWIGAHFERIGLQGVRHQIYDLAPHHTSMDTPDLVPAAGLQCAVQAFAKIVDEVNRMDLRAVRADMYP